MANTRKAILKVYNKLYKVSNLLDESRCFYCGRCASTIDHVPPISVVDTLGIKNLVGVQLLLIPACAECNSLLSNKPLKSVKLRAQYLVGKYAEMYADYSLMPVDEDYSDYGIGLSSHLSAIKTVKSSLETSIETLWSIDSRLHQLNPVAALSSVNSIDRKDRFTLIEYHRRVNTESAARGRLAQLEERINNPEPCDSIQTVHSSEDEELSVLTDEAIEKARKVIQAYKNWMKIPDGQE